MFPHICRILSFLTIWFLIFISTTSCFSIKTAILSSNNNSIIRNNLQKRKIGELQQYTTNSHRIRNNYFISSTSTRRQSDKRKGVVVVENIVKLMAFTTSDGQPSDYDTEDIVTGSSSSISRRINSNIDDTLLNENNDDEDAVGIRDALKRELLLLSSITNRGEYTTLDEQNIIIDIIIQLEALNPTYRPANTFLLGNPNESTISTSSSVWDLCLSSTQFFRSSPFFQSIRTVFQDISNSKAMIDNAFDIHDRATTASRIGRVRQTISIDNTNYNNPNIILLSEVDLEVGILPGIPFRLKGTVATTAKIVTIDEINDNVYELQIISTTIKNSNIPFVNDILFNNQFEIPVGEIYENIYKVLGFLRTTTTNNNDDDNTSSSNNSDGPPRVINKTLYLDESMRITRDQDDNFFVFTRA